MLIGILWGFLGLYLTAEQLSRFGKLVLDNGFWKSKQLIHSFHNLNLKKYCYDFFPVLKRIIAII